MKAALVLPHQNAISAPEILPIGIAYIAGLLQQIGLDVCVLWNKPWHVIKTELEPRISSLSFVGMQVFATNYEQCIALCKWIKQKNKNCFILLGGTQVTNFPEHALSSSVVDLVVRGEGETATQAFITALQHKGDIKSIPGTVIMDHDSLVTNPDSDIIHDLDTLPQPAWDLFYSHKPIIRGHMLTHRGCPYNCANCPVRTPPSKVVREYSLARMLVEIETLYDVFGARDIEFFDEAFTLNRQRVVALCQSLLQRKLDLTWRCYTRINHLDKELCELMYEAGCRQIFLGLGTGIPKLLNILRITLDFDEVKQKIRSFKKIPIDIIVTFSLGLPTETFSDTIKTILFGLSLPAEKTLFQACLPFPGSELHRIASRNGTFSIGNWDNISSWNDIVFVPRGRHKAELKCLLFTAKSCAKTRNMISRYLRV
ncbi:cobalamin-dependent protein [bacterium]|nr:cobalamin-dependent protein [bacterium]